MLPTTLSTTVSMPDTAGALEHGQAGVGVVDPEDEKTIRKAYDRYIKDKDRADKSSNEFSAVLHEVVKRRGVSMYAISKVVPMTGENIRTRLNRYKPVEAPADSDS